MQKKPPRHTERGFSVFELAFVILVLGLVALVAVPRMQSFKARGVQSEARAGLAQIHSAMQSYYASHGDYPSIPQGTLLTNSELSQKLGVAFSKETDNYHFSLHSRPAVKALKSAWAAAAVSVHPISTRVGADAHDIMRLNMNNWLCAPYDGVSHSSASLAKASRPHDSKDCPQVSDGSRGFSVTLTDFDVEK
jgi:type II secretory pathway pseudopilin PulG